ncbi:NADPH-dependent F420 reductase [Aeromicrobium endophyticum]|uniref:NADPH-dependent F420 reductase n=1 Tax=Aeromicrobium endophyticum TaxID=2292704 RepID=UPI0036156D1B
MSDSWASAPSATATDRIRSASPCRYSSRWDVTDRFTGRSCHGHERPAQLSRNGPERAGVDQGMTTIGLIGSGHIGSQIARAATAHGHDVVLSNSRGPETLGDLVAELGPRARAATPAEAAAAGDIVVVTIPLKAIGTVPVEPLDGKVVIDTNNYYPQRDGHVAALDDGSTTSSQLLQDRLPGSHVVKAFNHIAFADITDHAQEPGTDDRRALAIAGDDEGAKATVASLIDELGFDVVDLGTLAESWRIQPDTPGYGPRLTADGMRDALAAAQPQTS